MPKNLEEGAKELVVQRPKDHEEAQGEEASVSSSQVDVIDEEKPVEFRLMEKHEDWTAERLEQALTEKRGVRAKLAEELSLADAAVSDAATRDEGSLAQLAEVGEDDLAETPHYDKAKRLVENQFLRHWSVSKSVAELDLVSRLRKAGELDAEIEGIGNKIPKAEEKAREAADELQNLRYQVADCQEERRQTLYRWKDRIAEYEDLRAGPKLREHRKLFLNG